MDVPDPTFCREQSHIPTGQDGPEPIAIVGMAMRLPGGVQSAEAFWKFMVDKKDGLCRVPDTRYRIEAFYDPIKPNAVRTENGYFLEENIWHFDSRFFGISEYEASRMDPQQRLLLEVVWECLENAGETNWCGREVGCYVGVFGEDWIDMSSKDSQSTDRYHVLGTGQFALSNRISYEFDLQGPSMTILTGCSSSLVGLHEACQALTAGECEAAIVAGSNLILTPTMTTTMSANLVLAPDGRCKTFDGSADGYGRGEAVNAIYIKRLSSAMRHNDPIRAVIRATSTNCDGKTPSITTPGSQSQERLILKAYHKARINDIGRTGFFECHGTGTTVGDGAETAVVAKLFGKDGIFMGAVKPNVGHSEGASGVTSIIKAALSLEKGTIPPNIWFQDPNPKIPFVKGKLEVPREKVAWPSDRARRVSVNCFGIGGSNVHAILDAYDETPSRPSSVPHFGQSKKLLVVSAKCETSLEKRIRQVTDYGNQYPDRRLDLTYTMGCRRTTFAHRAFTVIDNDCLLELLSFQKFQAQETKVSLIFTGQGAQWPGMGKSLIRSCPNFDRTIRDLDDALKLIQHPPQWTIREVLQNTEDSRIHNPEFSQPLCTAVQIGLANILEDWGIEFSSVVGHSSGEIAAAYAAKALPATTAIALAYYRGRSAMGVTQSGCMAAVGLGPNEVSPFLRPGVVIACENSPQSVSLSGDKAVLLAVMAAIQDSFPDALCRELKTGIAYHSEHMLEIADLYQSDIEPYVRHNATMLPLYSTVLGQVVASPKELDASYWYKNLVSPVRFSAAIQGLLESTDMTHLLLEVGPHAALSGPVQQTALKLGKGQQYVYIPTLIRPTASSASSPSQLSQVLCTAGKVYAHGGKVDLRTINGTGNVLTDLPRYPWSHDQTFMQESRLVHEWRFRRHSHHELLGSRVAETTDKEPVWRNLLHPESVAWLWDHKLQGKVVFPCAGFIAMIGEAIQQITPETTDFSIKQMVLKSPLILDGLKELEVVTSLRQTKLSSVTDSEWYEFGISSMGGGGWTRHCHGHVRAGSEKEYKQQPINKHVRSVCRSRWYKVLSNHGMNYGPQFMGLHDITVDPSTGSATAAVGEQSIEYGSRYFVHPTAIDNCLQLFSVAFLKGLPRQINRIAVPISIEHLYVGRAGTGMTASARPGPESASGSLRGDGTLQVAERVVLELTSARFFQFQEDGRSHDSDMPLISHLNFKPDVDLLNWTRAVRTIDCKVVHHPSADDQYSRICNLCILETAERIRDIPPSASHLRKWKEWLQTKATGLLAQRGVRYVEEWLELDSKSRADLLSLQITEDCNARIQSPILVSLHSTLANCEETIRGTLSPMAMVLDDEDPLTSYVGNVQHQRIWSDALALLGHANPAMRVLQIGGSTGRSTRAILHGLRSTEGVRQYGSFTFTDPSPALIDEAKRIFKTVENTKFLKLDISCDLEAQGVELASFDLIVASNVWHNTRPVRAALTNIRRLLTARGWFLLHDFGPSDYHNYIHGALPGWWCEEELKEDTQSYRTTSYWDKQLKDAGFTGIGEMVCGEAESDQMSLTVLTRPVQARPDPGSVTLLVLKKNNPWTSEMQALLTDQGYRVLCATLDEPLTEKDTVIISLLDLDGPFLDSLSESQYYAMQDFLKRLGKTTILWVTGSAQLVCHDPRFGLVFGLARTVRHEQSLDFRILEVDKFDTIAAAALVKVFEKIRLSTLRGDPETDHEFVLNKGVVQVGRFNWGSPSDFTRDAQSNLPRKKLDIAYYGITNSLQWKEVYPDTLQGRQVEVEVKYVGLNFRDLMVLMGAVGCKDELGIEGSGIVRRVGPGGSNLAPGDRVVITGFGILSTSTIVDSRRCFKIPAGMSLEDAATMPTVYATAIYSLVHLGAIRRGQSVLIHSACGGVGLACVQVCRILGAKIYATVGNSNKAEFLAKEFDIPSNCIFSSRSASFVEDLMRETNNRGVDIVLNSLAGKLLHASWRCVAPFGKMVELGKRDLMADGILDMGPFLDNRSFHGVDLVKVAEDHPEVFNGLWCQCMSWFEAGKLGPIHPIQPFDASDIVEAFRYMQSGNHIGKVVIQMDNPEVLPTVSSGPEIRFSPDVAFLLVGGLGGLGTAVSRWMVEKGARNLVYLSPSAGQSDDHLMFLKELRALNCTAVTVQGSVADLKHVQRAIASAPKPIAGVLQMSIILCDRQFENMSYKEWTSALSPKVSGTWNLHYSLLSQAQPLDFFVVFSSTSGVHGNMGQANYAAANTFLDAFVQYRRGQGLAASSLALGAVEEIGIVSKNPKLLQTMRTGSVRLLQEDEFIQGLELAIQWSPPGTATGTIVVGMSTTGPSSDTAIDQLWASDARFSLYRNMKVLDEEKTQTIAEQLRLLLEAGEDPLASGNKGAELLITRRLGEVIISHIALARDMKKEDTSNMVIDSFISIEIRSWIRRNLGLDISLVEIAEANTVGELARVAAQHLRNRHRKSTGQLTE